MIVAGDALLDRPSLTSQGAGVGFAVGRVDATQTTSFAAFPESWLTSSAGSLPSVQLWQFCSD